jgi:two-component system response regulator MprA
MPLVSHQEVGASLQSAGPAAHRRVLVVDDDPRSRNAVARLLTEEGYDATVAADGEEASGLLASWHPDLVLTDLNMPRLDGCGLLKRVNALVPGTPVIVLSARSGADGRASVEGMGVAGFFAKPVQIDELLARIHDLIGH